MAFTVEDGTGVEDANAYITLAFADSYHSERGNTTWTGADSAKEIAIIKATDYVEQRYGRQFKGRKEFPETPQGLSFPRLGVYDRDGYVVEGVPLNLQRAIAEYALQALTTSLFLSPTIDESGNQVIGLREKVGPIETEKQYVQGNKSTYKIFPAADALMRDFIIPSGNSAIRN